MALPMLMNGGADCGPSNALQGFSKQFDQDRGAVHDHFGQGSGPSRETFRTRPSGAGVNPLADDAARFFNGASTSSSSSIVRTPFDVGALRGALPAAPGPATASAASGWAADFARAAGGSVGSSAGVEWARQMMQAQGVQQVERGVISPAPRMQIDGTIQHSRPMVYTPMSMPAFNQYQPALAQSLQHAEPEIVFPDVQPVQSTPVVQNETTNTTTSTATERSELAETARQLLNALQNETRPKFQNSQFMGLMRQLRDGEVVVQDGDMIPASEARPAVNKGKEKASTEGWATEFSNGGLLQRRKSVHFDTADPSTSYQTRAEDQTLDEATEAFDNADVFYDIYNRTHHTAKLPNPQAAEWAHLQDDWDAFEATASGIKPVEPMQYQFQENNPYLTGTRTHELHRHGAGLQQSVLEHEAIVQRDPSNAQAWLALGVKQQENERERHAIDALREAVARDPDCMPAYLALAVSFANEGDKVSAHRAIGSWMTGRGATLRKVAGPGELGVVEGVATVDEIHQEYIHALVNMARQSGEEIDADIQIALGVLLNTVEDYNKAQDCFRTALAVRPDDWLLFNRVGATLANSGNPTEAVPFYYKALELNPGYIRARYNLGISCINLRRYDEAAQHLVDALVLQDSEGLNSDRGVTSDSLWDTLRSTCLSLQRLDLASICESRDIQRFINKFHQAEV
ncbi:peroxisomal targeting signal 1 receptor [Ceratobasidium sp. AG-Ba]|nr:peroxisomal targeting signal 1 receptor [Ceratobasidium sp. AG-Ba]